MTFCGLRSWSLLIRGKGILNTIKSVAIFIDALMYQMVSLSRHLPAILLSQNAATGRHIMDWRNVIVMVQHPSKMRPTVVAFLIIGTAKMRRYCNKMDILRRHIPVL